MTGLSLPRWVAVGIAATFVAGAMPAVAGATDYCVAPNTGCEASNNKPSLEAALAASAGADDADRIFLGAWAYEASTVAGYSYQAPNAPVEIIGAGIGQTILTAPPGAEDILLLSGGLGTTVSDLTVRAPANVHFGFTGIRTNNTARHIEVTEDSAQTNDFRQGLCLTEGGTLEDSKVQLGTSGTVGVFLEDGHVRRSALSAVTGVKANSGTIEQSRVEGETGVDAYAGVTSIVGSQIVGGEDYGIRVSSYAHVDHSTVNADSVTIVGAGVGKGAYATTQFDMGWSADVNLSNSVIRGFPVALGASAPGAGAARVTTSWSDYDPSGNSSSGNAHIDESNVSNVGDAGFVDAAHGDYHLLAASPLVDAGDPTTAQGLDLDGNSLVADGNGDGSPRRDLGAYELPSVGSPPNGSPPPPPADTAAPMISGFRATPALFAVGRASTALAARMPRGTRFRYSLTEQARVALKIQRRLEGRRTRYRTVGKLLRTARQGANRTRFTGRLGRRALRPGRYRVRISATDAAGNRSLVRTTRFRIARG